jgi:hypothetical protein
MDEQAYLQLRSIIDQIPNEDQREIVALPAERIILLHHGLGTWIRNLVRSGEVGGLFRWACNQAPDAKNLDEMVWPIIREV